MTNDNSANNPVPNFYRASAADFKKIPGSPIAYWISSAIRCIFSKPNKTVEDIANPNQALVTGNTDLYIRKWFETPFYRIGFGYHSREDAKKSGLRWFPYNKGGDFRNWYGNFEHVVNWKNDGQELQTKLHPSGTRIWAHNFVLDSIFKEAIVWSKITSGKPCFRYSPDGFLYDDASGVCSFENGKREFLIGLFCSKVNFLVQSLINPTLNVQPANLRGVPLPKNDTPCLSSVVSEIVNTSKADWDSYETSWDFTTPPFLQSEYRQPTIQETYIKLRAHWKEMTLGMQQLEKENNRIFIEAYVLQDELTPEVPLSEITLICNPFYRYNGNESEEELEALLLTDTIKEFISYAVGCMFGRYSLDKPGLILANQGETIDDYLQQVPEPSFMPDDDNIIPILEDEYFTDDIVGRFREFLKPHSGQRALPRTLNLLQGRCRSRRRAVHRLRK